MESLCSGATADGGASLRVLLIVSRDLTRRGLEDYLRDEGATIVGQAASVAVGSAVAAGADFDVAVVEALLRDGDGIELVVKLRAAVPGAIYLVLASTEDEEEMLAALAAGANGYVASDMELSRLGATIRGAAHGEAVLSRHMTAALIREYHRIAAARPIGHGSAKLTLRERQVLELLSRGRRTGEIAGELFISVETVRSHVKSLMRKLNVRTRAAAVARLEQARPPVPVHDLSAKAS